MYDITSSSSFQHILKWASDVDEVRLTPTDKTQPSPFMLSFFLSPLLLFSASLCLTDLVFTSSLIELVPGCLFLNPVTLFQFAPDKVQRILVGNKADEEQMRKVPKEQGSKVGLYLTV